MKNVIFLCILFAFQFNLFAQKNFAPSAKLSQEVMPRQDNKKLMEAELASRQTKRAPRFAVNMEVNMTPTTHGEWEVNDEGKAIWRLKIYSAGAMSLNFGFGKYILPETAELYIYNTDQSIVRGPFTPADNEAHEQLWTPVIHSDEVVIHLEVDEAYRNDVQLRLDYVNHDFFGFGLQETQGEKAISGSCNLDVICGAADGWPQNDNYRDIMRSVGVYSLGGGTFCTGFLVNNTCQDQKPMFMTADHCGIRNGNAGSLVVYWLYENSTCRQPNTAASGGNGDATLSIFNTGSTFRSTWFNSDFTLVELDDPVNPNGNPYFAGWRNDTTLPTNTIAIHHPNTDEKRISYDDDPACPSAYDSNICNASQDYLKIDDWDIGTTEGGSSGSPLFDQDKYVIGQLSGGDAACGNNGADWYGWFHSNWNGGGSPTNSVGMWLDPCGTGATTLPGLDNSVVNCPADYANGNSLTGTITGTVDYETDGVIQSNQIITGTPTVDYDSNTCIELLNGFEVRATAVFNAFIDGCMGVFRNK